MKSLDLPGTRPAAILWCALLACNRRAACRPKLPTEIRLEELSHEEFSRIGLGMDPRTFRIFRAPIDDDQLSVLLTAYEDGKPASLGYQIVRAVEGEVIDLIHATIDWKNELAHIGQVGIGDPGFLVEGLMREATKVGSPYVGWHSMSILEGEWRRTAGDAEGA